MVLDADSTSQAIYFDVLDSTSITGGRKTGLAYNTASLTAYYTRQGGSATAITLATLAAANSAYSSGGFKEVDATNAPGIYRLDIPDAALVNGVNSVSVTIKGATGMVQATKEISLRPLVPSVNVTKWLGTACATPTVAGVPEMDLTHAGGTAITQSGGRPEVNATHFAGTAYATAVTAWIAANWDALTSGMSTVGSIGKKLADWVVGTIDTYTGNTKQTGDNYVRLGAPVGASISADIAGVPAAFGALVVSTGFTVLKIFRLVGAAFGGKTSGVGTATITIRNVIDTLDALVVGMTGSDRTSMTFDLSA